ncbi:MAG: hypothetical protein JKY27_01180 [Magnetovibrio sp.]|nr:hypothetical protein [Magnetovibrio sp.]
MTATHFISGALLLWIVGFEAYRRMTMQPFSMLSMVHLLFVLGYCIPPFWIYFVMGTSLETGPYYEHALFIIPFYQQLDFANEVYRSASLHAVLLYVIMMFGYWAIGRLKVWTSPRNFDRIPRSWIVLCGVVLGALSLVALVVYAAQFGSLTGMIEAGREIRAGRMDVRWGFLQIIVLLGIPATIFLSAAGSKMSGKMRVLMWTLAALVWWFVALRAYHSAGRLTIFTFLAFMPLGVIFYLGFKNRWAVSGFAMLLITGLFVAAAPQILFSSVGAGFQETLSALSTKGGQSILYILNEFAFPYLVSARTPMIAPDVISYRYFVDIPLTGAYMLPSLSGTDTWPPLISHLHQATLTGFSPRALQLMPIDLVSFGYYNLGTLGVAITGLVFGGLISAFEKWLSPGSGLLAQLLRAAWMLYIPFLVLYAAPYTMVKAGFGLIVGTVLVLVMVWLSRFRASDQASWET